MIIGYPKVNLATLKAVRCAEHPDGDVPAAATPGGRLQLFFPGIKRGPLCVCRQTCNNLHQALQSPPLWLTVEHPDFREGCNRWTALDVVQLPGHGCVHGIWDRPDLLGGKFQSPLNTLVLAIEPFACLSSCQSFRGIAAGPIAQSIVGDP